MQTTNHQPPLNFWRAVLYLAIATAILSLWSCTSSKSTETTQKQGAWYSVKWLKKNGYQLPATSKKSIYIRFTKDSSKANIIYTAKSE